MADCVIKSQNVLTEDGLRPASIFVLNGKILHVITDLFSENNERNLRLVDKKSGKEVNLNAPGLKYYDFGHLPVLPGNVDTHVHINEPGRTEWEGFETATKAAAAGGITTLIDMPLNCSPVTTTALAFDVKEKHLSGKLNINVGFYGGVIPGNVNELNLLIEKGVFGFKAFMIDSGLEEFPFSKVSDLKKALSEIKGKGIPLLVHAELETTETAIKENNAKHSHSSNPLKDLSKNTYKNYLKTRPDQFEVDAVRELINLCREFNTPIHIVHLSSAKTLPMIKEARKEGLPLTVETCPHYLCLNSDEISDGDTRYKCTPPIRDFENSERLWQALQEGLIDSIVSDHSPCNPELKALETGDFEKAWGGISSLQFGMSSIWTEARKRGISLEQVSHWMSNAPSKFIGLERSKGKIKKGFDADFMVFDPNFKYDLKSSMIHHKHKITPFEGKEFYGKVISTFCQGEKVFTTENGVDEFSSKPKGEFLRRN